ncbi:MAG: Cys-tRNA(Pro) deacylase [Anaerolineae bacterium]|jgi:Cys-tRNA(Pro)/Cys-tRNA(Cys) deacylase|nr:Cys-tRNA(Pro) deacylase [Anaerolineae bacterium]MBT7074695.1 Cys-tRNA(Pro) deacylase [Anaerolineae bacterium]MBT7781576.1 Cys-tRNA(Pro) deacylase [Anaerolineae bacterium]
MSIKNNITRFLDAKKISYTLFETPKEKLGAEVTADFLGISSLLVYKTIVVKRKKGKPILALVSGNNSVDLKALAKILGEKKVFLTTQSEAEKITKLQTGGISPLALINKGFQVALDEGAQEYEQIHISGGQRGLNIRIGVADLIKLTNARVGKFKDEYEIACDIFFPKYR